MRFSRSLLMYVSLLIPAILGIVGNSFADITFGVPLKISVGGYGALSASATSGEPVILTSSTPTVCTVSGVTGNPASVTVKALSAGQCTIAASTNGADPDISQTYAIVTTAYPDTITDVVMGPTVTALTGLATVAPTGVASVTASDGNYLFIADSVQHRVVMINLASGSLVLSIGTGVAGFVADTGTTGLNTTLGRYNPPIQLSSPAGVAVDPKTGDLYIADSGNNRVHRVVADTMTRRIGVSSTIITVAGNGIAGFSGDGGTSNLASLNNPTGVAVDSSGNVLIADSGNNRIRKALPAKIDTKGVVTYGNISTLAGDGTPSTLTVFGIALSPASGDLYIADSGNNRILKMTATGTLTTIAGNGVAGYAGAGGRASRAQLDQPSGVATDGINLYVADTMNHCIRMISLATGVITTRAGNSTAGLTANPVIPAPAPLYPVIDTVLAPLSYPMGVNVSATGDVYIADTANNRIEKVAAIVSAITSATPPGGSYTISQTVTLTASKAAAIYYRLNGQSTDPYTRYTGALSITTDTTLTFYSVDVNGHEEVRNSAVYVIDPTVPNTAATIAATTAGNGIIYSSRAELVVTLQSSETAAIYYTTTGVAPAAISANAYTGTFTIPVTSTLTTTNVQFFAVDLAGNKEVTKSQKFTIVALSTTMSPTGGTYRSAQTVTLTSNHPQASIYYTTDGSEPTSASSIYSLPIPLAGAANSTVIQTLKFYAYNPGNLERTPTQTQIYIIDMLAPTTTASPKGSAYNTPQTVTLTSDDPNATIYYTLTGIAPTTASPKYTAPITIIANTTLMYFAVDPAGNRGVVKTDIYTVDTVAPVTTASLLTGTYASIQSVTLTCNDPKASIYYSTDGTQPTDKSAKYTAPLTISKTTTLRYFAKDVAGNPEAVATQTYTIITLATTASPRGGAYNSLQTVELTTNGVDAKIYYTLNPLTPTPNYNEYKLPILLYDPANPNATTQTLLFFSIDAAGVTEVIKTENYTLDSVAPSTTVLCGSDTITLTAKDALDSKPSIKYIANADTTNPLTNISIPAYTLSDYAGPIPFTVNTIIKYFATDVAGNTEQIKTAYCTTAATTQDPSLYLTTLATPSDTSNVTLFITGNVAPFGLASVDFVGGGGPVTPSSVDGGFTTTVDLTAADYAGSITIMPQNGTIAGTPVSLNITLTGATTPNSITIGKSNGVIGNTARVPITFTSGSQAAAVGIDIAYDPETSPFSNPSLEIAGVAAAVGKIISGGVVLTATGSVYRVLIMDPLGGASTPIPDGDVAYLKFTVKRALDSLTEQNPVDLVIKSYEATDLTGHNMDPGTSATNGAINIVSQPGNSIGYGTGSAIIGDVSVTLGGVLSAVHMLLGTATVDSAVDLNGDGKVKIDEVQKVINAYVGM